MLNSITLENLQHESITLKPKSTDSKFKDIVVNVESAEVFKILGIFERVLAQNQSFARFWVE